MYFSSLKKKNKNTVKYICVCVVWVCIPCSFMRLSSSAKYQVWQSLLPVPEAWVVLGGPLGGWLKISAHITWLKQKLNAFCHQVKPFQHTSWGSVLQLSEWNLELRLLEGVWKVAQLSSQMWLQSWRDYRVSNVCVWCPGLHLDWSSLAAIKTLTVGWGGSLAGKVFAAQSWGLSSIPRPTLVVGE